MVIRELPTIVRCIFRCHARTRRYWPVLQTFQFSTLTLVKEIKGTNQFEFHTAAQARQITDSTQSTEYRDRATCAQRRVGCGAGSQRPTTADNTNCTTITSICEQKSCKFPSFWVVSNDDSWLRNRWCRTTCSKQESADAKVNYQTILDYLAIQCWVYWVGSWFSSWKRTGSFQAAILPKEVTTTLCLLQMRFKGTWPCQLELRHLEFTFMHIQPKSINIYC